MTHTGYVADYIVAATGTALPTEPLHRIRQRMKADGLPTIIVTVDDRPVGVIRWSDIRDAAGIPGTCLARDIMLSSCPTLMAGSLTSEAAARLTLSDLDRLPVVDIRGKIVGMVPRAALFHDGNGRGKTRPVLGRSTKRQPRRAFTVHPGMNVISSDGMPLGLVDRMFIDRGTVTGFLVACGPGKNRHKHLSFDVVDHLEGETILLSIDADAFHALPDMQA